MKTKPLTFWDNIPKDIETQAVAEEGDLITSIGGVAFLIQRRNDYNNIVCIRYKKSKMTFQRVIWHFVNFLKENKIQYIRVEGNERRYNFFLKLAPKMNICCIKDIAESEELHRNVFYLKIY